MGCSVSKQKRPSMGSKATKSCNKVVNRGVSIQEDRSIKPTYGRYSTAVFSSNHGITKNPAPVKELTGSASWLMPSVKGSYPQHQTNVVPTMRAAKHLSEDIHGDTVLGVKSRSLGAQTSTIESLETINILELMEGLAEKEVSASSGQWHASDEPSMLSRHIVDTQRFPPEKPADGPSMPTMPSTHVGDRQRFPTGKPTDDSFTQSASLAARRPRPKTSSSLESIEDEDLALSAQRSKTPSRDSNVDINRCTQKISSDAADMMVSLSFRNPGSLQRALSFKYMFNDYPAASQIDERNTRLHLNEDVPDLATARLWSEDEGEGASASLAFSPVVSLKWWLSSSNHQSNSPGLKSSSEPSVLDALQILRPYAPEQPHHYPDSVEAQLLYVQGASPSMHHQEGTANLSTGIEEYRTPIFDPEMLDSFENAMKHLSKEEWDAVRGMEDSPQTFLHLVKALKKSSSNSVHNQTIFGDSMDRNTTQDIHTAEARNTKGLDSMDQFRPMKREDMKVENREKKLAFMRQSSLEMKEALVRTSMKEEQERASVVFYSMTARTDAKIYEDCNQVRNILQSLVGGCYVERSISELLEHEQELKHVLNMSAVIVPTICVKGKYLVGAESIMQLHKKGLLGAMLH